MSKITDLQVWVIFRDNLEYYLSGGGIEEDQLLVSCISTDPDEDFKRWMDWRYPEVMYVFEDEYQQESNDGYYPADYGLLSPGNW